MPSSTASSSSRRRARATPARTSTHRAGQESPPAPTAARGAASGARGFPQQRLNAEILVQAEVALAGVAQHGNDVLAGAELALRVSATSALAPALMPASSPSRRQASLHRVGVAIAHEPDLICYRGLERSDLMGTYLVDIAAMVFAFSTALYPFLADELASPRRRACSSRPPPSAR